MATNSSKFLIGLFVIVGVLILAGVLIWVGAAKYFAKGSLYAVYFDESVQGLQVDSATEHTQQCQGIDAQYPAADERNDDRANTNAAPAKPAQAPAAAATVFNVVGFSVAFPSHAFLLCGQTPGCADGSAKAGRGL